MAIVIGRAKAWIGWLLGACLAGLGALGMISCSDGGEPVKPPDGGGDGGGAVPGAEGLDASPEWRRLCAAWKEAEEVSSGKRGPYPFNEAGRKKLLDALKTAGEDVGKLAAAEKLTDAEAGLLRKDLAVLTRGVQMKRPTEMRNATCYLPMPTPLPARDSAKRLKERLPLLEKLAAAGGVKRAVMNKVLTTVDKDLATLGDEKQLKKLQEAERKEAAEVKAKGAAAVRKIRMMLAPPRPMCYAPPARPMPRKPQSAAEARELLARIDRLEGDGRLLPSVADKLREGIHT